MKAYEQLTVGATAVGFNPEKYNIGGKATFATVTISDAGIRWLATGDTPTADKGIPAAMGDIIELENYNEVKLFRAIRTGGTDAVLDADFAG